MAKIEQLKLNYGEANDVLRVVQQQGAEVIHPTNPFVFMLEDGILVLATDFWRPEGWASSIFGSGRLICSDDHVRILSEVGVDLSRILQQSAQTL